MSALNRWRDLEPLLFLAVASASLALTLRVALGFVEPRPPLVRSALLNQGVASLGLALGLWLFAIVAKRLGLRSLAYVLVLGSATCASGRLAALGSQAGVHLFYLLLACLAPLVFHLHQGLLAQPPGCAARSGTVALTTMAGISAAPVLLIDYDVLASSSWFGAWRTLIGITSFLGPALSMALLAMYWWQGWPEGRSRQVRVALLGNSLSVLGVAAVSAIPLAMGSPLAIGYNLTWPALLLAPALLIDASIHPSERVDLALQRAVAVYLHLVFLATLVMITTTLLNRFLRISTDFWPFVGAFILAALWPVRGPLWDATMGFLDSVWSGGGASYRVAADRLIDSFPSTDEPEALRWFLVHRVPRALHISWSALYLESGSRALVLVQSHGVTPLSGAGRVLPGEGGLARYLVERREPVAHRALELTLEGDDLDGAERVLLGEDEIALWVPLEAEGELGGLLLLGPKQGREPYTLEDIEIIHSLADRAAVALQTFRLKQEVEERGEALARAHRQLLEAGERERLRLARDLHDGAVQQLIGISYLLAAGKRTLERKGEDDAPASEATGELLESARRELLDVVTQLRALIGELRPAGLKELGLEAALSGYVAGLARGVVGNQPTISLNVQVADRTLPEGVALALFRIAQEGLRNALRHAGASHIRLRIDQAQCGIELLLEDDGKGFVVPAKLNDLASRNHFGLVTMSERAAQVGGKLTIRSVPQVGTELRVYIPLDQCEGNDERKDSGSLGG